MLYVLSGKDFLIQKKLEEITQHTTYRVLSYEDKEKFSEAFIQEANKRLFGGSKFLVIYEFKDFTKHSPLLQNAQSGSLDIILVYKNEQKRLLTLLEKLHISYKTFHLDLDKKLLQNKALFQKWVQETTIAHKISLHPSTIAVLSEVFLNAPDALFNELQKLSAYKAGHRISQEELRHLVRWPNRSRAFEVAQHLREKNFPKFFHYLKREILLMKYPDKEIPALFRLIQSTIFSILLVKYAQREKVVQDVPLHHYYKNILLQAGSRFTDDELKKIHRAIASIERQYKKFFIKKNEIPETIILAISH